MGDFIESVYSVFVNHLHCEIVSPTISIEPEGEPTRAIPLVTTCKSHFMGVKHFGSRGFGRILICPHMIQQQQQNRTRPAAAAQPQVERERPSVKRLFHGTAPLEVIVAPVLGPLAKLAVKEKFKHLSKSSGTDRLYFNERYESKTAYQEFLSSFYTTLIFCGLVAGENSIVYDWQSDIITLSLTKDNHGNPVFDRTRTTFNPARPDVCARHHDEMSFLAQHKPELTYTDAPQCNHCGLTTHPSNLLKDMVKVGGAHVYAAYTSIFSYGLFDMTTFLDTMAIRTKGYIVLNDYSYARKQSRRSGNLMDNELSFYFEGDKVLLEGPGILGSQETKYLDVIGKAWIVKKSGDIMPELGKFYLFEEIESMPNGDVPAKLIKVTRIMKEIPSLPIIDFTLMECGQYAQPRNLELETRPVAPPTEAFKLSQMLKERCGKQGESLKLDGENITLTVYKQKFFSSVQIVDRTYTANVSDVASSVLESFGKTNSADLLRAQRILTKKGLSGEGDATGTLLKIEAKTNAFIIAMHLGAVQFGTAQSYSNSSSTLKKARETLKGVVHDFRQGISWDKVGKLLVGLFVILMLVFTVVFFTSTSGVSKPQAQGRRLDVETVPVTGVEPDQTNFPLLFFQVILCYMIGVPVFLLFLKFLKWLTRNRLLASREPRSLASSCVTDDTRLDMGGANVGRCPAN